MFTDIPCTYDHLTHAVPENFECVPHDTKPNKFVGKLSKCLCVYTDPHQTCEEKGKNSDRDLSIQYVPKKKYV